MNTLSIYQILCLVGFPSLFVGAVGVFYTAMKKLRNDNEATRLGIQALLRAQMIAEYHKYISKGYAPIYARENFENCYKNYHRLGGNGVMTDLHDRFMLLPTERPEVKE